MYCEVKSFHWGAAERDAKFRAEQKQTKEKKNDRKSSSRGGKGTIRVNEEQGK